MFVSICGRMLFNTASPVKLRRWFFLTDSYKAVSQDSFAQVFPCVVGLYPGSSPAQLNGHTWMYKFMRLFVLVVGPLGEIAS